MELLHHALPPALRNLNLHEGSLGCCGDDPTPERLRCEIGWHLTYFPRAWVTVENIQRQCAADT